MKCKEFDAEKCPAKEWMQKNDPQSLVVVVTK